MSDSDSEEDCGLIQPSLIKQLKSILDQYPDDGQILKEMIQNAEDAGATEVTFLYDQHIHGTNKLHQESLAKHQGPGLLAFNNASFTEEDWNGIRRLYDSIKEKDPLKVGRFGLGFKSVFHLTDLPSVLSDQKLLILDPHENLLNNKNRRTSGKSWDFEKDKRSLIQLPDQFSPYFDLFGCSSNSLKSGRFKGTLFRFPLRRFKSKLSHTIYDDTRMKKLFHSFETDANLVLLFLKKVERIALATRGVGTRAPNVHFVVQIAPSCRERVRKERAIFLDKVLKSEQLGAGQHSATQRSDQKDHISTSYAVSIEKVSNERVTHTFLYLVRECYAGGSFSTTLHKLREELEKSYLPMVGVAMLVDNDASRGEQPDGQTFCVLPLPREKRSSSGLPVHVNGYFSVSQNRRHLKWKTAGQQEEQDNDVAWNHSLLTEILPQCYVELIKNAIELEEGDHGVTLSTVYASVPDINQVDEKWAHCLKVVFGLLLKERWLHTSACGGKWVTLDACYLDNEIKPLVREMLLAVGYNIVTPPIHVQMAIGHYRQQEISKVTPQLVRNDLKNRPAIYSNRDDRTKLALLEFVLQDDKFDELDEIWLLPLEDGTFGSFGKSWSSRQIFIPSSTLQCRLLQEIRSNLLSQTIKGHLLEKLLRVAEHGNSCLKKVTPSAMPALVKATLPTEWNGQMQVEHSPSGGTGPSAQWFKDLWEYLMLNHEDLAPFRGLMILPLTSSMHEPMQLIALSENPRAIMAKCTGAHISSLLCDLLSGVGFVIVHNLLQYVKNHPAVLGLYIKMPTAEHVLDALLSVSQAHGIDTVVTHIQARQGVADDILTLLAQYADYTPGAKQTHLLKQLPLFQTIQSSESKPDYASVWEVTDGLADHRLLSSKLPFRLLLLQDKNTRKVAEFLGVKLLSFQTFLERHLIPSIRQRAISPQQIKKLMMFVFENIHSLARENPGVYNHFSDVAFVETDSRQLLEPCNLFDPNSSLCKSLFSGMKGKFPCDSYTRADTIVILSKMGLIKEQQLTSGDVEQVILSLQSSPSKIKSTVSGAILEVLGKMPQLLSNGTPHGRSLLKQVREHPWVPVVKERPNQYPKTLGWMGSSSLCKPGDVVGPKCAFIAGSTKAVAKRVGAKLAFVLNWDKAPSLECVVLHLQNVIDAYQPHEKVAYLGVILEIYKSFQNYDPGELMSLLTRVPWVWTGDTFAHPGTVTIKNSTGTNLRSYANVLPEELQNLKQLFVTMGVKQNVDTVMLVNIIHRIKILHEKSRSESRSYNQARVSRDLQLILEILTYIRENFKYIDETVRARILVPVQCSSKGRLELSLVKDCAYSDVEWIREGYNDEEVRLVHRDLPVDTARELGVPAFTNRIVNADELQFEAYGQAESLTNRISHLLVDYTDGLAVVKEMIQNADDAGAREVKFLYDERMNDDARTRLLDPNMEECQGPALWVYNDAVFKDDDFSNIIKLGNTSKGEATDKIGQFGLGFNVVYNLTDVPSFITHESIVIFDPDTSHLDRALTDKTSPGIKLTIEQNRHLFKTHPDQFKPYQGIYGCELSDQSTRYHGTLFRLPLRTARQAATSKICQHHYDRNQMIQLLQMLEQNGHGLLLFTQKVRRIEVDHLAKDGDPEHPTQLLSVQKTELSHLGSRSQNKSDVIQTTKTVRPGSRGLLFSQRELSDKKISLCTPMHLNWLVTSVEGSQSAVVFSKKPVPSRGCVAMQLKEIEGGYRPQSLINIKERGQVFCGLPLPVYSDLPVHINATFAVQSSRRGLIQSTGDDKHNEKLDWNRSLMQGVLTEAYLYALEEVVKILPKTALVEFHTMWPVMTKHTRADQVDVEYLLESFFSKILERAKSPILHCGDGLVNIHEAVLLDENLGTNQEIQADLIETLTSLSGATPVKLPISVYSQLKMHDQSDILAKQWYEFGRYFREIVFPNLKSIEEESRDRLLSFALQRTYSFKDMLSNMDVSECVGLLATMKEVYDEESLSKPSLSITVKVLSNLVIMMLKEKVTTEQLTERGSSVYIPNEKNVLMPVDKLYYAAAERGRRKNNIVSSLIQPTTMRALGVKDRREHMLDTHSKGIPFGQCEDLTNAIKRVLQTYPCDHEILKELIQNADDAKATQIHFIYDQRNHPSDNVFSDSWKALQGPALCVYNNSPFTEKDLTGIQQFGVGAKGNDPAKTGQYGIGFSSVYHLTDVPSLLTSGPDIPMTLCVFDPHCEYVQGANREKPGRQYTDLIDLKEEFPDVFLCYLEEHFKIKNATMLRLPLRSSAMANKSFISRQRPNVRKLFDSLQEEAADILLFLNHLQKIEISEVNGTGELDSRYVVVKKRRQTGKSRAHWSSMTKTSEDALLSNDWTIKDIPVTSAIEHLKVTINNSQKQQWCVTRCLGISPEVDIPLSIEEAFKHGDLRLLPQGGVAARTHPDTDIREFKGRAFCLLPMPLETGLPVHINGHFALGHENRRHLWTNSDRDGYKKVWNDFLCEHVISAAYVKLLVALKELINDKGTARNDLEEQLSHHQSYFPVHTDSTWQTLVGACYKRVASVKACILPIIKDLAASHTNRHISPNLMTVNWRSFQEEDKPEVLFPESPEEENKPVVLSAGNVSENVAMTCQTSSSSIIGTDREAGETMRKKQHLARCLIRCQFGILYISESLTGSIAKSDIHIKRMSPAEILAGFTDESLSGEMGGLPNEIGNTPIQDIPTLCTVLKYCAKDEHFLEKLDGLPLLLTADGKLRKFDGANPAFVTIPRFQTLFPTCANRFVETNAFYPILNSAQVKSCTLMKEFDIEVMSQVLKERLRREEFCVASEITMQEGQLFLNSYDWLPLFWSFVDHWLNHRIKKSEMRTPESELVTLSQTDRTMAERQTAAENKTMISQELQCIEDWCLIPTCKLGEDHLVAIKESKFVLGFCAKKSGIEESVYKILKKCGSHQLFASGNHIDTNIKILPILVTSTGDPQACLHLLHSTLHEGRLVGNIDPEEAMTLLKYFNANIGTMDKDGSTMRKIADLPLHLSLHARLVSLTGKKVYILPEGVPVEGFYVSQKSIGTLFLGPPRHLKQLYQFLECKTIRFEYLYCSFIFPQFELFTEDDRNVHLYYLYGKAVSQGLWEMAQLLQEMGSTALITDAGGSLKLASYFRDQRNPVFAAFKPELAPPAAKLPFSPCDWRKFLMQLGLTKDVSIQMFSNFARLVAERSKHLLPSQDNATRSKTLMKYIFDMRDTHATDYNDQSLKGISTIGFIEPAKPSNKLTLLCPKQMAPHGFVQLSGSIITEYEELVWTQVRLLPDWADPETTSLPQDERKKLRQLLGIQGKPPVRMVADHLSILAKNIHINASGQTGGGPERERIFKKIYGFIQENMDGDTVLPDMTTSSCILVENGEKLVLPSQVTKNVSEQIRPFLYKVPDSLVAYQELFVKIGVTETVSVSQYVMVLRHLYLETHDKPVINPNHIKSALKAVGGLFSVISQGGTEFPYCPLYLPGRKDCEDGIFLHLSTQLVHNDVPSFFKRIEGFEGALLVNLMECGLEPSAAMRAVEKLPQNHRPRLLSKEIEEVLEGSVTTLKKDQVANRLNKRIQSESFGKAVQQLLLHEECIENQSTDQSEPGNVVNRLKMITVHALDRVLTVLRKRQGGEIIDGSSDTKLCHVKKSETGSRWDIYLKQSPSLSQDHLIPLAKAISQILDGKHYDFTVNLLPLFTCKDDEIDNELQKLNVHTGKVQKPFLPRLGTSVPQNHRRSLKRGISCVDMEDYVAYTPGNSKVPVYAIITGETGHKRRRLDIGDNDPVVVDTSSLQTF